MGVATKTFSSGPTQDACIVVALCSHLILAVYLHVDQKIPNPLIAFYVMKDKADMTGCFICTNINW